MASDSLTDFGEGMGTPDYASPEQIRDAHSIDARADIYSLGCTLYFLLAGQAPFSSVGRTQKVVGHLERKPQPLGIIRKDVPKELVAVLDRMLAKQTSERFQTAAEVAGALVSFSGGKRQLPWNSPWQRRLVLAGLFGLFAILAGLGIHKLMVQKEAVNLSGPTGCMLFSRPTDTIRIDGGTILESECTFEARVLFTDLYSYPGTVFDEWTNGEEDKYFGVGPDGSVGAMIYPTCNITVPIRLKENAWHHVAYVYDGMEARFYLDGKLIASKAASGKIGNGDGQIFIGAIPRPPGENPRRSFMGYLDTLRISTVARYRCENFDPPNGDLASDEHTALLFNFNEPAGSKTLIDESAHGLTGSLGVGFEAATSPQLVPDPLENLQIGAR